MKSPLKFLIPQNRSAANWVQNVNVMELLQWYLTFHLWPACNHVHML